ncbi:MAG: cation-transporting P-type ATPase, partial [Clostridia bacterium]|nr:cation-transporting P-type ATPase [Clostridia bacterium]
YDTTILPQEPESGPFRPLGLIGIQDPLRPEARDAVLTCRAAGIHTVMITGDHRDTAAAIAREAGILRSGETVMTGKELDQLSEEALLAALPKITVFARVTPAHKLRIVKAFRSLGRVVCMTGDGVNDAPALKAADIGLAMGAGGTEVAREASDMVLTDSNFATIVEAVREGRGIFQNIRRALHFLLSSNIGEILTIFGALLLSAPPPLSPIQLLWVNLVTDSLPALALGFEPPDRRIMEEGPVKKNALFGGGLPFQIATEGIMIGLLSLSAYFVGCLCFGGSAAGMTLCFGTLSLSQLIHAFNMRSDRSLFSLSPFSNRKLLLAFALSVLLQLGVMLIPGLQVLFAVAPLPITAWGILILFSLFPLVFGELYKLIMRPGHP